MYICGGVYIYVCVNTCTNIYICRHLARVVRDTIDAQVYYMYICMCVWVCIFVCLNACANVYIRVYMYVCIHTYIIIHAYLHKMCVCVCVCKCVCVCVCVIRVSLIVPLKLATSRSLSRIHFFPVAKLTQWLDPAIVMI